MPKTFLVAFREFRATVLTKGFIVAITLPLIMGGVLLLIVPLIASIKPPPVKGSVAVIDRTGVVAPLLRLELSPEVLVERSRERTRDGADRARRLAGGLVSDDDADAAAAAIASAAAEEPTLVLEELPPAADAEAEKERLRGDGEGVPERLALIVIDADAVVPGEDGDLGGYQPYVRSMLDERVQVIISRAVRRSISDARMASVNYDPERVRRLLSVEEQQAVTITPTGERRSLPGTRYIVPIAFILLLMVSSFSGGQYLLTTTIEEKSNRVIEVLLSAVSPMELMVGKILGQMAVGLLILITYTGLGVAGLVAFALMDVLTWMHLLYLLIFFFLAFFMIASIMAAVGSAVQEVHEAQSLIGPITMVLIVPWLLMPAIVDDPNSTLSKVLSVTPPIAPFVMVQRVAASSEPIPVIEVIASIAVAGATAIFSAWAAAKIFRIGVLMYGKPPNLATLARWVRDA